MKKTYGWVAAAALFAAGGAHAAPELFDTWGVHDTGEVTGGLSDASPIDGVVTFALAAGSNLSAAAVSNDLSPVFHISDGNVALYADNGDTDYTNDSALGSFNFSAVNTVYSFGSLLAGAYFYRVTGNADGSVGGNFLLSSTISAVPEAQTYALMLAGLGIGAFVTRRRKNG